MKIVKGEYFMLLNTVIWGGTFVIIKLAFQDISPMVFLSVRFFLASMLLVIPVIKMLPKIEKQRYIEGIILGILLYVGFGVQTIGLNFTTATKSGFITGSFVVCTPILQLIIDRKLPNKGNIIGIVLVFFGMIMLASKGSSMWSILNELESTFNFGDFLTFICAVFYSLYIIYLHKVSKKHDPKFLSFFQIAVCGVFCIISAIFMNSFNVEPARFNPSWYLAFTFAYTVILATIVTTYNQTRFQEKVSPAKTGIIFSFEPIFAAVFAVLILNEKISGLGIIGCICIFSGLVVSELWPYINKGKNASAAA